MNLSDVRTRVRELFGDTATVQLSDAMINSWANDGQLDVVRKTECLQAISQLDPVAGTEAYALPADFLRDKRVSLEGHKLRRLTLEQVEMYFPHREVDNSSGTPHSYWFWEDKIYLYPIPSTTGTDTIDLWYIKIPATLTGSDPLTIPEQMHEDVVRFALCRAKEQDEDWRVAQSMWRDYEARVAMSMAEFNNPRADSYAVIRSLPSDDDIYFPGDWM